VIGIPLHLQLAQKGFITKAQCAAAIGFIDLIQEAECASRVEVRLDAVHLLNRVHSALTPGSKKVLQALLSEENLGMAALILGCHEKHIGFLAAVACDELVGLLEDRRLLATGTRTMDLIPSRSTIRIRVNNEKNLPKTPGSAAARKAFRSSVPWLKMRFSVLAENAERNGGVATCELCSSTSGSMHVDHIEALSRCFEKRLDRSNLQVLCADCNIGKLDGTPIDFRKSKRQESAPLANSPSGDPHGSNI
jgi:hypothetical protein